MKANPKAMLALEDGTFYEGTSFGFPGERPGEVVFNTSMTGYQEILTDPSYRGRMWNPQGPRPKGLSSGSWRR
jgi:carbamoyl-phosphate synthase small subunit